MQSFWDTWYILGLYRLRPIGLYIYIYSLFDEGDATQLLRTTWLHCFQKYPSKNATHSDRMLTDD